MIKSIIVNLEGVKIVIVHMMNSLKINVVILNVVILKLQIHR